MVRRLSLEKWSHFPFLSPLTVKWWSCDVLLLCSAAVAAKTNKHINTLQVLQVGCPVLKFINGLSLVYRNMKSGFFFLQKWHCLCGFEFLEDWLSSECDCHSLSLVFSPWLLPSLTVASMLPCSRPSWSCLFSRTKCPMSSTQRVLFLLLWGPSQDLVAMPDSAALHCLRSLSVVIFKTVDCSWILRGGKFIWCSGKN